MRQKHAPCSCGCGELADECMGGGNPLAAFTVVEPVGSAPLFFDGYCLRHAERDCEWCARA